MPWSAEATASTHAKTKPKTKAGPKPKAKRPAETADTDEAETPGTTAPATSPAAATEKPNQEQEAEHAVFVLPPPRPRRDVPVHHSQREICDTLAKAAQSNRLPVPFFIRLLFQESKFEARAVSHAGAQGIAQFMPKTAASVGLDDPFDPLQAIPAAARLLRELANQFGNFGLAAAAYNAGAGRVNEWLKKKGGLPNETRGYVKTITGQPAESWKTATSGHGGNRLPHKAPCRDVSNLYAFNDATRIPLPPTRPVPDAVPAPEVQTARADEKKQPKGGGATVAKGAKTPDGKRSAVQFAARRRQKAARRPD